MTVQPGHDKGLIPFGEGCEAGTRHFPSGRVRPGDLTGNSEILGARLISALGGFVRFQGTVTGTQAARAASERIERAEHQKVILHVTENRAVAGMLMTANVK